MKIERRGDGADERRILMGMVTDKTVLSKVGAKWTKEGLFKSPWANLVGKWCVDFFEKYDKPPMKAVEPLFETWAKKHPDKDTITLVEKFLSNLSGEYVRVKKDINPEYLIDQAGRHFNKVAAVKFRDEYSELIEQGDLDKAEALKSASSRIELGAGGYIDLLADKSASRTAILSKGEALIKYKGALGDFWGDALERDAFAAIMAPEKTGKSWALMDLGWRAMLQHRRVAYFVIGDMSQNQVLRRFQCRAAKRPLKACTVRMPTSIFRDPDERFAVVEHEEKEFKEPLSWKDGWRAFQKVREGREGLLRTSFYPALGVSIKGIRSVLQKWQKEDWSADVVIIDYADNLAPPSGAGSNDRLAIGETWARMRGLAQECHALLITATQTDAAAYHAESLTRSNFSENKMKNAQVTFLAGATRTSVEKANGIMRLNRVQWRDDDFNEEQHWHVATCLALANPFVHCCF